MSIQGIILKVQKKSGHFSWANHRELQRENDIWNNFERLTQYSPRQGNIVDRGNNLNTTVFRRYHRSSKFGMLREVKAAVIDKGEKKTLCI